MADHAGRSPGCAVDMPGGGAHRHPVWRGVRAAKFVFWRGGQHFHLLRFLCDPTSQSADGIGRALATVAGGLAAQFGLCRAGIVADRARAVKL